MLPHWRTYLIVSVNKVNLWFLPLWMISCVTWTIRKTASLDSIYCEKEENDSWEWSQTPPQRNFLWLLAMKILQKLHRYPKISKWNFLTPCCEKSLLNLDMHYFRCLAEETSKHYELSKKITILCQSLSRKLAVLATHRISQSSGQHDSPRGQLHHLIFKYISINTCVNFISDHMKLEVKVGLFMYNKSSKIHCCFSWNSPGTIPFQHA